MALNPNISGPRGPDSNNQVPTTTGQFKIQPTSFNPTLPYSHNPTFPYSHNPTIPVVPQPMGTNNASQLHQFPLLAPHNGFPMGFPHTVPGLVPGGNILQSREYPVPNNSHPVHGESHINNIPQGENSHENSHNSSSWSSGFTNVLQNLTLDHSVARTPSHHTQDNKVSHNFNFQQIYANSRDVMQTIYFSLNTLFDVAQIRTFENFYSNLDNQIAMLIPHVSHQTNKFNVQNLI